MSTTTGRALLGPLLVVLVASVVLASGGKAAGQTPTSSPTTVVTVATTLAPPTTGIPSTTSTTAMAYPPTTGVAVTQPFFLDPVVGSVPESVPPPTYTGSSPMTVTTVLEYPFEPTTTTTSARAPEAVQLPSFTRPTIDEDGTTTSTPATTAVGGASPGPDPLLVAAAAPAGGAGGDGATTRGTALFWPVALGLASVVLLGGPPALRRIRSDHA
ncbi:MAG TPA: hypothetical protein VF045_07470 [Acidimicrobiales bacterium]